MVRCLGCDLLITWPRPDEATLAALYGNTKYYERRAMGSDALGAWRERAAAIFAGLARNPRSVLDFGAGQGHLIQVLREAGLCADGIETSATGRTEARRLYGLELWGEIPGEHGRQFDLITLIHSLEHVPDPVAVLARLRALLTNDGVIFIEVPNAGSVDMLWPQRRREILDLPAHLYQFVPLTLSRVVERAGLRVVDVRLSNPDLLEWILTRRARWKGAHSGHRARRDKSSGGPPQSSKRQSLAMHWASGMLPWVRRCLPGAKLQLLATGAGE